MAVALLGAGVLYVGDPVRTAQLVGFMKTLTVIVTVWLVAFPVWATLFPARAKQDAAR